MGCVSRARFSLKGIDMEQVVANIYAACLSAEAEPHAGLVDLTINAVQDGLAGPNKDETLGAIFTAVQELTTERQQKGALFRIKLTAIAAAAKVLSQNTRDALLKSLRAMGEVANQHSLSATSSTISLLVDSIAKVETAVGQVAPPPASPRVEAKAETPKAQSNAGLTLQQYLVQHARHAESDKIAFAPDIPLKKMSGTLNSIGGYVDAEDVAVVIDDTVFGGSKEGVFITNDRIFVKEAFTDLAIYRLDSIQHIGAEGRKIFINRRQIVSMTQPDKSDLELLFSTINEYLQSLRGAPQPAVNPASSHSQYAQADSQESAEIRIGTDFFDGLVREMRSAVERGEVDDLEHYELIIETVVLSGTLHRFCTAHCPTLSAESRWAVQCDPMRFAIFTYLCSLIQWLLVTKCNFNEDEMTTFMARFLLGVVVPYSGAMEAEHYEYKSLRRVANPELYFKESPLLSEWRSTAQGYLALMDNEPGELPEAFHDNLEEMGDSIWLWGEEQELLIHRFGKLRDEFLTPNASFAYMRGISQDMENSMVRFFERVNF